MKFRRLSSELEAIQWKGDNLDEMREFCGVRSGINDRVSPFVFNPIGTYLPVVDSDVEGELWLECAQHIVPVPVGDWVVKDDRGFYACKDEVLNENNIALTEDVQALLDEELREKSLVEDLASVINRHSAEVPSGTPDFILANYLRTCLMNFNYATTHRASWRGESVDLPSQIKESASAMNDAFGKGDMPIPELDQQDLPFDDLSIADRLISDGVVKYAEVRQPNKIVPLVMYDKNGQRNEIGTASVNISDGEVLVDAKITGAVAIFEAKVPEGQYSISVDEKKDESIQSTFQRYLRKGLGNG
jgi:hypothetical protein